MPAAGQQKGGSSARKAAKKSGAAAVQDGFSEVTLQWLELGSFAVFLFLLLLAGHGISSSEMLYSPVEGRVHILVRLIYFVLLEIVACGFFASLLQQFHRRAVGKIVAADGKEPRESSHDSSIVWPRPELLSPELRTYASKQGQPFFLNHVPGRWRCRDALMRFGMTLGVVVAVLATSWMLDKRAPISLGLAADMPFVVDMVLGFIVGVSIVAVMFFVELQAGWLHHLQFFEVFDSARERFSVCFFWDVVFHMNVAFNEELPVRGWMLVNLAEACAAHFGLQKIQSFMLATAMQSLFFVAMHLSSPGGTRLQSILNIFMGGVAGGVNVLLASGKLGFALGWHFGWNISMGNVFGLSTSGIPISATVIAVAPLPDKESLHGGVFGPEGGVVAPVAYSLGIVLAFLIYGFPQWQ